jgi:hypothetical protein
MRFDRQRVTTSAIFALHGAVSGTFAARLPELTAQLRLSPGQLGAALFMSGIGSLLAMPLAGRWIHRFGNRRAVRTLVACWCAALLIPAWAVNLWTLALGMLCYGAASGLADVAQNAQGVVVENATRRPVMPSLHGLWSIGGFAASGIGVGVTALGVSYRIHLTVVALSLAAAAFLIGSGIADTPRATPPVGDELAPPRFSLPTGGALLLGLLGFCTAFAEGSGINWSAIYVSRVTHATPAVAAAAYAVFAGAMAVVRLCGNGIVRAAGAVRVVRFGSAVAALGGALVVLARSPWPVIAGFGLLAAGTALIFPLTYAAAGRLGRNPGEGIAGAATVFYSADLISPGVIGGVADATSLPVALALVTALTAAIVPGARLVRDAAKPTADAADIALSHSTE